MSKRYIFLSIVFIALGMGLVLLPAQDKGKGLRPEILLLEVNSTERFISPDLVAERLINEDPRIFLVDVRSLEQYDEYHLPGAINMPLNTVLNDSLNFSINQKYRDVVFYSNGNITADQAWMLCRQKDFKNLYVMQGGLNKWFDDIMRPKSPQETDADEAFALYRFRQGASVYFGMPAPSVEYTEPIKQKAPKAIITAPAPKKEEIILIEVEEDDEDEEGC